jgi:hypothetical protein
MLWPKKFIKGARPGLKRLAQVTSDSATNADFFIFKLHAFRNFCYWKCLDSAEN